MKGFYKLSIYIIHVIFNKNIPTDSLILIKFSIEIYYQIYIKHLHIPYFPVLSLHINKFEADSGRRYIWATLIFIQKIVRLGKKKVKKERNKNVFQCWNWYLYHHISLTDWCLTEHYSELFNNRSKNRSISGSPHKLAFSNRAVYVQSVCTFVRGSKHFQRKT